MQYANPSCLTKLIPISNSNLMSTQLHCIMSLLQHHSLGNHTSWQLTTIVSSLSSSATWSPTNVSPCNLYMLHLLQFDRDKWVLVSTTCRVIRLWIEERPPIWKAYANIFNKPLRTADM